MRNFRGRRILAAGLLLGMAFHTQMVSAQEAPAPKGPEKRGDPAGGAAAIERAFGLSQAEARRQANLTQNYEAEAHKIATAFPQNFLASMVDYGRNFSITLVFDRDIDLAEVQKLVDPALRPHLRIRRSQHSGAEIKQFEREVLDALRSSKIDGSVGYMWEDSSVTGTYRYNCTVSGTGCSTGQWANVHPTLPLSGHLAVTSAIKGGSATGFNPTHPVGARRCKQAKTTGVSCGPIEISSSSFVVTDSAGTRLLWKAS